jgi:hypothetical protein
MKNAVFWDFTQLSSCKNQHSSEASVLTRAIWRNIPENGILHKHHHENLKSYTIKHVGHLIYALTRETVFLCEMILCEQFLLVLLVRTYGNIL